MEGDLEPTKAVRVAYLERNKVLKLPVSEANFSELELLETQFRREFLFDQDADNVGLTVTFQRFDPEWEEYIDLELDAEIKHKDKLKAVVTARLVTPIDSSKAVSGSGLSSSADHSPSMDDSDTIVSTRTTPSSRRLLDSDDEVEGDVMSQPSSTSTPCRKKRRIEKVQDDSVPLPDPFPLPKHYRSDVESALKSKKMTKETRSSFLSSVASAMLTYKRYPTRDDYTCVARTVVAQYKFMASPTGTPYGAVVTSLINRFKNFRCVPVKRNTPQVLRNASPQAGKLPGITSSPAAPTVPPGEDSVSFERHNKILRAEFKKSKPNGNVISDLMGRSFALRRKDVLANSFDLETLFGKFPFLQDSDKLIQEMELITERPALRQTFKENWASLPTKVLEQAKLEAAHSNRVATALKSAESVDHDTLRCLMILPFLLPDVRTKVDASKIIVLIEADTSVADSLTARKQLHPYILVKIGEDLDVLLVTDGMVVCDVPVAEIPLTLMSAYFVFNICYPKGTVNFFTFLEVLVLGFSPEKASATVKHLLSSLSAL